MCRMRRTPCWGKERTVAGDLPHVVPPRDPQGAPSGSRPQNVTAGASRVTPRRSAPLGTGHQAASRPSRRTFLQQGLLATVGLSMLPMRRASARPQPLDPITFDLHLHPGEFFARGTSTYAGDEAFYERLRDMRASGMHGGFVSLVSDAQLLERTATGIVARRAYRPGEAAAEYERQLAILQDLVAKSQARIVRTMTEFRMAIRDGGVGLWLACEGSECLDGDPERVDRLWTDGVRSIQLVHYALNAAGDLQTQPSQHGGLSALGKQVVQRLLARRMLVDVAHADLATVRDVVRLADAPIILSHSLLSLGTDRPLSARTITPEHAKLVASTGGVIGAWPSGTNASFAEFVENTKRLADVVGVEHVGLGTDMDGSFQPVMTSYRQLREWMAGLQRQGFTEREVTLMAGGNMERVLTRLMP